MFKSSFGSVYLSTFCEGEDYLFSVECVSFVWLLKGVWVSMWFYVCCSCVVRVTVEPLTSNTSDLRNA